MWRLICLALALCTAALQCSAGAWPREKGTFFLTSNVNLSWPMDIESGVLPGRYYTAYLEYGATERLTLGLDLGKSVSGGGKAVGFVRMPLNGADARLRLAGELGVGQIEGASVIRPGLSLGHGFELGALSSWLALDGVAEIATTSGRVDYKMDVTFGLGTAGGRKYMLQVQLGAPAQRAAFVRLVPSVVIPIGTRRYLEIGGSYGVTGDDTAGVKLGVWQSF